MSDLTPSQTHQLQTLIDFSTDAVVSRTLLKKQAGTVTLFAFDRGQELSEHTAPFDAIVQVLDGEVELTIGGIAVLAKAGEVVLMPANIPHALKASSRIKMLLTMIKS